jgi:hypothetical protein
MSLGLFNPRKVHKEAQDESLARGFLYPTVVVTRLLQHYTVCSQILLVVSICRDISILNSFDNDPCNNDLKIITCIIQTNLFVLYHFFIYFGPEFLTHIENFPSIEYLKSVVSWKPPINALDRAIVWTILKIQHVLAPLHYWIYFSNTDPKIISYNGHLRRDTNILFFIYGLWNFWCWYVQGVPPYPIQSIVYEKSERSILGASLFYIFCILVLNICHEVFDYLV